MDNRYGGMPSGPGDFFLAARASVRRASYVGGGGLSNCGYWGICWPASVDHGLLRCNMRCILRQGTGSVDWAGGLSRVCLTRR